MINVLSNIVEELSSEFDHINSDLMFFLLYLSSLMLGHIDFLQLDVFDIRKWINAINNMWVVVMSNVLEYVFLPL